MSSNGSVSVALTAPGPSWLSDLDLPSVVVIESAMDNTIEGGARKSGGGWRWLEKDIGGGGLV